VTQAAVANNTGDLNFYNNPQSTLDLAKKNPDQHLHFEAQTMPAFVTTNFGIGVYGKYSTDAQYSPSTGNMQYNYFNDFGAELGYCFRLFGGRLHIAASGKMINRVYVNALLAGSSSNLSLSNLAREGTGAGVDAAVMLSGPWIFLPTITAVVHDVGGTNFTIRNGIFYKTGNNPPPQEQEVNVAIGIFPIYSNYSRGSITVEYDDVLNPVTADPWRNWHAGVEFDFNDVFYIRGGFNEHYWTAGLEFDLGRNQIQLASYGEEIGLAPQQIEDRRYVAQYGFRF